MDDKFLEFLFKATLALFLATMVILVFALLSPCGLTYKIFTTPHFKEGTSISADRLQSDYRHLNDGYFDGALPPVTIRMDEGEVFPGTHNIGETEIEGNTFVIHINPEYNRALSIADETLMHETCHIAVWNVPMDDDHGPVWQNCMLNLAKEGAFAKIW